MFIVSSNIVRFFLYIKRFQYVTDSVVLFWKDMSNNRIPAKVKGRYTKRSPITIESSTSDSGMEIWSTDSEPTETIIISSSSDPCTPSPHYSPNSVVEAAQPHVPHPVNQPVPEVAPVAHLVAVQSLICLLCGQI